MKCSNPNVRCPNCKMSEKLYQSNRKNCINQTGPSAKLHLIVREDCAILYNCALTWDNLGSAAKKDTVLVLAVVAVAVAVAVAALEVAGLARALAAAAPVFPASCFPSPVLGFSLPPSVPSVLLINSALLFPVLCCSKSASSALLYISPISPLCPCFPWMCTVHCALNTLRTESVPLTPLDPPWPGCYSS